MIEYQYRGLPHAHLVVRLDDAHDIDDPNREDLIYFVNRHLVAEMPCFEGEEYHNVYEEDILQHLLTITNKRQLKLFV